MEEENYKTQIGTNIKRIKTKILVLVSISFILVVVFSVLGARSAQAATLYLSPTVGSYNVGQAFSVNVYISSAEQAMNAASGVIAFPADKLEISSLSKAGSIFSLWVQEPTFSNASGVVNFEGIVLNPGFQGSAGKIVTINLKAKSAGSASLSFNSGSVLANDGRGTNILAGLGNATFNLVVPVIVPSDTGIVSPAPKATTPSETPGTPIAPEISSSTHPDSNSWYSQKKAKFTWALPAGVTAVRLLIDKNPQSTPNISYTSPINSKEMADLDDGILYLHVRLKNAAGWGAISHFRFQIDTKPPEPFSIKFIDGKETKNPRPTVVFTTTDFLSGVDYYKIKIGEEDYISSFREEVEKNPYTLPPQSPGKRTILVQAFDKAGNYTAAIDNFVIQPIESPKITDYPHQLHSGDPFIIKGTTYANSQVTIWIQEKGEEAVSQTVESDREGKFTLVYGEKLKDGIYKLWAEVVDEDGARSLPTEKIVFAVFLPTVLKFGKIALDYLTLIITLTVLIIGISAVFFYSRYRIILWRKRVKKQTIETAERVHNAFNALRSEVEEQVSKLDGLRGLSKREKQIVDALKKALEVSESYISAKIKDIEKKLK